MTSTIRGAIALTIALGTGITLAAPAAFSRFASTGSSLV